MGPVPDKPMPPKDLYLKLEQNVADSLLRPISLLELQAALKVTKPKGATGPTNIPQKLLKEMEAWLSWQVFPLRKEKGNLPHFIPGHMEYLMLELNWRIRTWRQAGLFTIPTDFGGRRMAKDYSWVLNLNLKSFPKM